MTRWIQTAILCGRVAATLAAGAAACNDSTPPNKTDAFAGRYAVVAVDGKSLPGFVSASTNNPAYGYDSAWMQPDTLSLLPDSSGEAMSIISHKMAGQGVTVPKPVLTYARVP